MGRGLAAAMLVCACGGAAATRPAEPDAGGGSVVVTPDAGADAGDPDAGAPDAGSPDAGSPDAGTPDAGAPDAGPADAGPPGGGAWRQYRYDQRGGSSNPGVFPASAAADLVEL